ncbi:MAG: hypothetical protein JSS02_12580 [Planctomycetes bacterium]|nr:hypothetical protein [Planctomycetota bacterium]
MDPTAIAMCLTSIIECPRTKSSTSTSGGVTYYTYTADKCSCTSSGSTGSCVNQSSSVSITYTTDLGSNPNLSCTDYRCQTGGWTSGNDPKKNCVKMAPTIQQIPRTHLGAVGLKEYGEGIKFVPEKGYTVKTDSVLSFRAGEESRTAKIFKVFDSKGKPLYAVGFELKERAIEGSGIDTIQPLKSGLPYLYETTIGVYNEKARRIESVDLRIYTHADKRD